MTNGNRRVEVLRFKAANELTTRNEIDLVPASLNDLGRLVHRCGLIVDKQRFSQTQLRMEREREKHTHQVQVHKHSTHTLQTLCRAYALTVHNLRFFLTPWTPWNSLSQVNVSVHRLCTIVSTHLLLTLTCLPYCVSCFCTGFGKTGR